MTWRCLVLSGGGVTGEIEVGALQALKEKVPAIDMYCGNGVGSLHTSLLAQEDTFAAGAQAVQNLWDNDVHGDSSLFLKPFFGLAAGALWSLISSDSWASDAAVSTKPLRQLIEKRSSWERIAKKPNWAIGSTSLSDGLVYTVTTNPELLAASRTEERMLKMSLAPGDPYFIGDHFYDFVQAGAAVPLMFPPVTIWNHRFAEGGVRHYTPVSMAAQALALEVKKNPNLEAEIFIVDTWGDQAAWRDVNQLDTGQEILIRSLQLMVSQLAHGDLDLGLLQMKLALPNVKTWVIRPTQEFQGFTMGFDDANQRQLLRKRGYALANQALANYP